MATAYLLCGSGYGYLFEDYEQVCEELMRLVRTGTQDYSEDEDSHGWLCLYELEYDVRPEKDVFGRYGDERVKVGWPCNGGMPKGICSIPMDEGEEVIETKFSLDGYKLTYICES